MEKNTQGVPHAEVQLKIYDIERITALSTWEKGNDNIGSHSQAGSKTIALLQLHVI